jgi:hypothetical protein
VSHKENNVFFFVPFVGANHPAFILTQHGVLGWDMKGFQPFVQDQPVPDGMEQGELIQHGVLG